MGALSDRVGSGRSQVPASRVAQPPCGRRRFGRHGRRPGSHPPRVADLRLVPARPLDLPVRRLPADRSTLRSARIPLSGRRPRRPSTRLDTRRRSTRSAHSTPVHSIRGHAHDTPTQAPHTRYAQAQALRSAPASAEAPMPHTPRHASFRPSGTWAARRINRPTPTQCSLEPTGHLRRPDAYATLTLLRTTPPAPGCPVASAPRPRVVPRDPEHRSRAVEEAGPAGQTPLTPYAPTLPRTHEAASSLHAPEAAFPVPPGSGRRPRWQGGDSVRSVYGE
ncbi:hypothetical protein SAMN05444336_102176 [Albimonas donghaensis]|uniref:Uncharacterized protein n=1 Tax=Albimonas donghaensis TaxID=356660 RepID=A0A1H2VU73_9RHOB|nr:hypothetical protein SAMN05444336_102176 [Albimonas donghaensis]